MTLSMTTNSTNSTNSTDDNSTNSTEGEEETVRFLNLLLLDPTDAIAMWAPPNGTAPTSYVAEISYDGNAWRHLSLEEPDSTFAQFTVTEQQNFQFRVTPNNGIPAMETFTPKKNGKGKAGKMTRST